MEQTIKLMIEQAETEENYSLIEYVRQIIGGFAEAVNCPSNWKMIGRELASRYSEDSWVYENLELWNYSD